jgi:hypothetical protein
MNQENAYQIARMLTIMLAMSGALVVVGLYLLIKRWPR